MPSDGVFQKAENDSNADNTTVINLSLDTSIISGLNNPDDGALKFL